MKSGFKRGERLQEVLRCLNSKRSWEEAEHKGDSYVSHEQEVEVVALRPEAQGEDITCIRQAETVLRFLLPDLAKL